MPASYARTQSVRREPTLILPAQILHLFIRREISVPPSAPHHLADIHGILLLPSLPKPRSFLTKNREGGVSTILLLLLNKCANDHVKIKTIGAENNAFVNRESSSNASACISRSRSLVPCLSKVFPTLSGLAWYEKTPSL